MSFQPDISGFEIVRKLGEGQHSVAFLAIQQKFNREVVIKVLKNPLREDEQKQFFEEAGKITQLNYPNIAMVFDMDYFTNAELGKVPYIIMEYIQGTPLYNAGDIIAQNCLKDNLGLFLDLLKALNYAHEKGVKHGDLHPNNILLVPYKNSQVIKIIDFGLSYGLDAKHDVDLDSVKNLLDKFFFFPNIPLIKKGLLTLSDLGTMMFVTEDILNFKFLDEFVTHNNVLVEPKYVNMGSLIKTEQNVFADLFIGGYVPDYKKVMTDLNFTVFCFAKEFKFSRGFDLQVVPVIFQGDVIWEKQQDKYLITLLGRIANGEYGTFLVLLSLSEIFLIESKKYIFLEASKTLHDEDLSNYALKEISTSQCIDFIYRNGFMYHDVRIGMQRFFARESIGEHFGNEHVEELGDGKFNVSYPIISLNGFHIAMFNGILRRYRLEEIDISHLPNQKVVQDFSCVFEYLNIELFLESGYITVLLTAIERLFFDRSKVYAYVDNKLSVFDAHEIQGDNIDVELSKHPNSDLCSIDIIDSGANSLLNKSDLALDNLSGLYVCLLLEKFFRLPVSQFFRIQNANIIAIVGEGVYIQIGDELLFDKATGFRNLCESFMSEFENKFIDVFVKRSYLAELFLDGLRQQDRFLLKKHIIAMGDVTDRWVKDADSKITSLLGIPVTLDNSKEDAQKRIFERISTAWDQGLRYLNQNPIISTPSPHLYGAKRTL